MPEDKQSLIRRNGRRLGVIALAFGIAIVGSHIESGRARWSASAWSFALEVPGSPATWGPVILIAGILIRFGNAPSATGPRSSGFAYSPLLQGWPSLKMCSATVPFTSSTHCPS